jgi:hypothetical protein
MRRRLPSVMTATRAPWWKRSTFNGDPTGVFNWAGEMWEATATGSFSAQYDDSPVNVPELGMVRNFSVTGTMDSARATEGAPGHMGHERNGIFVRSKDE